MYVQTQTGRYWISNPYSASQHLSPMSHMSFQNKYNLHYSLQWTRKLQHIPAGKRRNSTLTRTFPSSCHLISSLITYNSNPPNIVPVTVFTPSSPTLWCSHGSFSFHAVVKNALLGDFKGLPPSSWLGRFKELSQFQSSYQVDGCVYWECITTQLSSSCFLSFPFSRVYPKSIP